jgi:c(7)-type cytochrome triheme protein
VYDHGKDPEGNPGRRDRVMKKWIVVLLLVPILASFAHAQAGTKKRRPLPYEYGGVVIGNSSPNAGLSPVQFDHWLHRAKYTCRLCHVDIGFAMKANATGIKAADNMKGYYCGTCHNGKMTHGDRKIFEACATKYTKEDLKRCNRCHSKGENIQRDYEFASFTARFPKERFGNGIDWEKTEELGLIKPIDYIAGISVKRPPLTVQKDFAITAKVETMPEIIFSHKKHTVWNGCELCHPEIFPSIRKGATKYTMTDIFEGKYCGACHVTVAFPTTDCQRCHTKPVR